MLRVEGTKTCYLAHMLSPAQPAPEDYYQNNFIMVFAFLVERYQGVASEHFTDSLQQYLSAPIDAQRLFARLLTRKGPIFLQRTLNYVEVADTQFALDYLCDCSLISLQGATPADRLLRQCTKQELLDVWAVPGKHEAVITPKLSRALFSLAKNQLVDWLLGHYSDGQILARMRKHIDWCEILNPEHWYLARLLFFGGSGKGWEAFVRQDLGQVRYEHLPLSQPQFANAGELEHYLKHRAYSDLSYRLDEFPDLVVSLVNWSQRTPVSDRTLSMRNKMLLRIGKWCERNLQHQPALAAYAMASVPPARERRIRILHKMGSVDDASALLNEVRQRPWSADEAQFAQRFGQRGGGYQPPVHDIATAATPADVEQFVLEQLLSEGGWGAHTENALPKLLAGLIYWPVIFALVPGAFTNPLQTAPHGLYDPEFTRQRQTILIDLERQLDDDEALRAHMQDVAKAKAGIANPLVSWGLLEAIPLEQWLSALPTDWIRKLSAFLIRNLSDYRRGFPDLFVCYPSGAVELVEVKGPGDQLQLQQRAWLSTLKDMDIAARVIRVRLEKTAPESAPESAPEKSAPEIGR